MDKKSLFLIDLLRKGFRHEPQNLLKRKTRKSRRFIQSISRRDFMVLQPKETRRSRKILYAVGLMLSVPLFFVPFIAAAFQVESFSAPGIKGGTLISVIAEILNVAIRILWLIAVAFTIIMFVVAGLKFLTAQGNTQQIAEARRAVLWGLVGVVVILLAWSIIVILRNQVGV